MTHPVCTPSLVTTDGQKGVAETKGEGRDVELPPAPSEKKEVVGDGVPQERDELHTVRSILKDVMEDCPTEPPSRHQSGHAQPSPATARKMLKDELPAAKAFAGDNYSWPELARVVNRWPRMLMELPTNDSDGSLVEYAVETERADFLRVFLLNTNGGANSAAPSAAALRRNAAAVLAPGASIKPYKPPACFTTAMNKNNWACMSALLDIVAGGFWPEAMKAPNPGAQLGPHVTDLLPEPILSDIFDQFPELASPFLLKLQPVRAYPFVADGCSKFEFSARHPECGLVEGSQLRSPPKFWQELLYPAISRGSGLVRQTSARRLSHSFVRDSTSTAAIAASGSWQVGQPVETLLVPLKGIVRSDSRLLASIVNSCNLFAAQGVPPYASFKSQIVIAMIEFKWNAFAQRLFLTDLGISLTYVTSFTASVVLRHEKENERIGNLVALICTAVLWFYIVASQYFFLIYAGTVHTVKKQERSAYRVLVSILHFIYGKSVWDRLQSTSLLGVAITLILDFMGDSRRTAVSAAFAVPLVYVHSLYYMQVGCRANVQDLN